MLIPADDEIEKLTRDNLLSLLETYARYAPEDRLPDSETWGHNAASALVAKVRALPLGSEITGILDEMLQSQDEKHVWLAAHFAAAKTVDLRALERALAHPDLPPPCSFILHFLWAQAVELGRIPWNKAMRASLPEVWAGPLIAAAFVQDHTYVLDHLPELLGEDPPVAMGRFAGAVEDALSLEEGKVLQEELRARQGKWGEKWTDDLIGAIQWYIDNNRLPSGAVRW